jgi:hypothetical protein
MRELLWITERELRERRLVLVGAFLLGLLTLAAPLLPSVHSERPIVVMDATATVMALLLSIGVAILAGGSAIGRDLAERRMGFYFSRPLGSLSIWGGKMLGALLLAIGAGLLVVLPVTFLGGGLLGGLTGLVPLHGIAGVLGGLVGRTSTPSFLLGLLALLSFLVVFANACNTALRARSKWILLDVIGLQLLLFFFWLSARPLLLAGADLLFTASLIAMACAFLLAIVVAGAAGLALGRADIRVVHRGLSQTLAAVLSLFVLCFAGYSVWVRSADPSDLKQFWEASPAPTGSWVNVAGEAAGRADYMPGFLINAATKESLRTGGMGWAGAREVTFSGDGTHAAWIKLASSSFQGPAIADVMMADLGPNPVVKRTNLTIYPSWLEAMALSPDGSRLATVLNGTLSVIEMKSEKSRAATMLPIQHRSLRLDFVSNELIRIYLTAEVSANARTKAVEIFELDIPTHHLWRTGAFAGIGAALSPAHDRLVTRVIGQTREYHVVDARTGAEIASLGPLAKGERGAAWLTSRGSLELVSGGERARAELHGADGRLTRVIDLGPAYDVMGGGEPAAGKMIVALFEGPTTRMGDVVLIDLDSGEVRKVARSLVPVYRFWQGRFPKPGSIATKLYEQAGRLVYFDPLTGERRVIAGK